MSVNLSGYVMLFYSYCYVIIIYYIIIHGMMVEVGTV